MQPARAAHGAFLARRKLAASGSSRAVRVSQPAVLSAFLAIQLFGIVIPPPYFPKEHHKERCGHSRSQRSFITFHGALRIILLSAGFPVTIHMIALEQTFANGSLQKFFLLLLPFQIESILSVICISFCVEFSNIGKFNFGKNELPYSAILPFVPCLILIFKPVRIILVEIFWVVIFVTQTVRAVIHAAGLVLRWGAWFVLRLMIDRSF